MYVFKLNLFQIYQLQHSRITLKSVWCCPKLVNCCFEKGSTHLSYAPIQAIFNPPITTLLKDPSGIMDAPPTIARHTPHLRRKHMVASKNRCDYILLLVIIHCYMDYFLIFLKSSL